jgi:hypothetical protein
MGVVGIFVWLVCKHWWALMSCAAFTFLGLYLTKYPQTPHWTYWANGALAAFFLLLATFLVWKEERSLLLSKTDEIAALSKAHEFAVDLLTSSRNDFQDRLLRREKELEKAINFNRPEVFAAYAPPAKFIYRKPDSWYPETGYVCNDAVTVTNMHGGAAYQVEIVTVVTEFFYIFFSSVATLAPGEATSVKATLQPRGLLMPTDDVVGCYAQQESGGLFFYTDLINGHVDVHTGLKLRVKWRDSGNNHFSSTNKNGEFSAIQREPTPLTEEEMQEAYEQDEDYG